MTDPAYFTLEPAAPMQPGGIATAALRQCTICDHVVESMGGPGSGSICPECATLLRRGQIKMDRETVVKAAAKTHP